jgi:trimethylamine:corrinoid methyltransferase-like protein
VIDRASLRAWEIEGRPDTAARARVRVEEVLAAYARPALDPSIEAAMEALVRAAGAPFGLPGDLPGVAAALA